MSYQAPAFMVDNVLEGITDVADIYEWTNTTSPSNATRRNWIDGRQGTVGTIAATGASAGIRMDFGSVPASSVNRVVIPDGHGFDGETIQYFADNESTFAGAANLGTEAITGSDVIDLTPGAAINQWFLWRINTSAASESFSLAGWWIGSRKAIDESAVDIEFQNGFVSQVEELEYPNGIASLEIAPPRRTFSLRVKDIDPASDDYTALSEVLQARGKRFWYWPPDTIDPGPFLVRLAEEPSRVQEFPAPLASTRYEVSLRMIEDRF